MEKRHVTDYNVVGKLFGGGGGGGGTGFLITAKTPFLLYLFVRFGLFSSLWWLRLTGVLVVPEPLSSDTYKAYMVVTLITGVFLF